MYYLYRYVCILNVFFICVYEQLSAIKNLLLYYCSLKISYKFDNKIVTFDLCKYNGYLYGTQTDIPFTYLCGAIG